jgi:hypothetical protein
MSALSPSTRRRLKNLRQVPSVWEGDRRTLNASLKSEMGGKSQGDCILWVDGSEGMVRSMDMVGEEAGTEAVVRSLLQAMEHPHSSSPAARPQKIVVRDRELQFYLRGVLQELDISVDYAPELPLIDEIFAGLLQMTGDRPPTLPPQFVEPLMLATQEIWHNEPWVTLDEEKIIAIELNYGDVGTLYLSVLGMLGMEFGLLMYRSLESLKRFREKVIAAGESAGELEEAFLEQDCLFLTFDEGEEDFDIDLSEISAKAKKEIQKFYDLTGMRPSFGNLHPLEGMRPVLYEEEAAAILVALQGLNRFFQQHLERIDAEDFPAISSTYKIADPNQSSKKVSVKISTQPEIAAELATISGRSGEWDEDDGFLDFGNPPLLRNDLIPNDAFYSLGSMPWDTLDLLRMSVKDHQQVESDFPRTGDGFPVILIQTSRPKAMDLIKALKEAGGLKAIAFNPGEDPISDVHYDLGIIQATNGEMHLFGEFVEDDPVHIQARKKWDQRCKKTKGVCGLVIAKGLKGASRGNPQIGDMMALFEARAISERDLGLGSLQLMPYFE